MSVARKGGKKKVEEQVRRLGRPDVDLSLAHFWQTQLGDIFRSERTRSSPSPRAPPPGALWMNGTQTTADSCSSPPSSSPPERKIHNAVFRTNHVNNFPIRKLNLSAVGHICFIDREARPGLNWWKKLIHVPKKGYNQKCLWSSVLFRSRNEEETQLFDNWLQAELNGLQAQQGPWAIVWPHMRFKWGHETKRNNWVCVSPRTVPGLVSPSTPCWRRWSCVEHLR